MIRAVIFDLDGLLSDTERLHCRAYRDALAARGVELTESEYAAHWIRGGHGIADLIRIRGLDLSADSIRLAKAVRYRELVAAEAGFMPGALELLRALRGRKRMALASSSYRDAVDAVVEALGVAEYFEVILGFGDVERAKPWPDLFLLAARRMRVQARDCVVLEDSEKGVVAAAAAGMRCIAVPNEHTRDHDFSKAWRVIPSLFAAAIELGVNP